MACQSLFDNETEMHLTSCILPVSFKDSASVQGFDLTILGKTAVFSFDRFKVTPTFLVDDDLLSKSANIATLANGEKTRLNSNV